MSTIIYTICERGNMSGVHNLNRKAFCILSRIPDLWMRTQTTRATELLVNLNSETGDHGKSTVARLLDLTDSDTSTRLHELSKKILLNEEGSSFASSQRSAS